MSLCMMATQSDAQRNLPLSDPRLTPDHYRQAAETALMDPFYPPTERQARHDYFLRLAREMEGEQ